MSKLAHQIKWNQNFPSQVVADPIPSLSFKNGIDEPLMSASLIRIQMAAIFSREVVIRRYDLNAVEAATKQIRAAVVEETFGEFRHTIMEARMAAANFDYNGVQEKLIELTDQMFNIE
jgi:hypothetical protein